MTSIEVQAIAHASRRREGRRDWAVGGILIMLILLLGMEALLAPPNPRTPDDRPAAAAR